MERQRLEHAADQKMHDALGRAYHAEDPDAEQWPGKTDHHFKPELAFHEHTHEAQAIREKWLRRNPHAIRNPKFAKTLKERFAERAVDGDDEDRFQDDAEMDIRYDRGEQHYPDDEEDEEPVAVGTT